MTQEQIIKRNFHKISDQYTKFNANKLNCRSCFIFNCYKKVTMSEGNALNPTFMICGEAPGSDEVREMRPFIGKAGKRLREELRKHKKTFNKNTTIITNVIPCRPQNNKFPTDDPVIHNCTKKWLLKEIDMLKPKVIITLGNNASKFIYDDNNIAITDIRGEWSFSYEFRAYIFSTYHPSYVNRCEYNSKKHVIIEFQSDIAKIAKTWSGIINLDYRMNMTEEEWLKEKSMKFTQ